LQILAFSSLMGSAICAFVYSPRFMAISSVQSHQRADVPRFRRSDQHRPPEKSILRAAISLTTIKDADLDFALRWCSAAPPTRGRGARQAGRRRSGASRPVPEEVADRRRKQSKLSVNPSSVRRRPSVIDQDPHRDRHLWPDRGGGGPLLGRADRAFAAQFPHRRGAHADRPHSRASLV
jgi:hypothetical protein